MRINPVGLVVAGLMIFVALIEVHPRLRAHSIFPPLLPLAVTNLLMVVALGLGTGVIG